LVPSHTCQSQKGAGFRGESVAARALACTPLGRSNYNDAVKGVSSWWRVVWELLGVWVGMEGSTAGEMGQVWVHTEWTTCHVWTVRVCRPEACSPRCMYVCAGLLTLQYVHVMYEARTLSDVPVVLESHLPYRTHNCRGLLITHAAQSGCRCKFASLPEIRCPPVESSYALPPVPKEMCH